MNFTKNIFQIVIICLSVNSAFANINNFEEIKTKAIQGDIQSQFELGNIYVNQVKDDVRAFEWFYKAAVQGNPTAQE